MPWSPLPGLAECDSWNTGRRDEAIVHKKASRSLAGGGGGIHTQPPGKSLYRGEDLVQMMVPPAPS